MGAQPWPRDAFARQVWATDQLRANEKLVALCFADHAGDQDVAWVTYPRLMQRTGLKSRDAVSRALSGLVEKGWLQLAERAHQWRSTRYRLVVPQESGTPTAAGGQQSGSRTPDGGQESASATADESQQSASASQQSASASSAVAEPDRTTPPTPLPTAQQQEMRAAVQKAVPKQLRPVGLKKLLDKCIAAGWTGDQVADELRNIDLRQARSPALVVAVLRDLASEPPPPPDAPPAYCELHLQHGQCSGCRSDAIAAPEPEATEAVR